MKHAICLLANRNIEYIIPFINQFNNNKNIFFYIHWHNHSDEECKKLQEYSKQIKYIIHNFNTKRYSSDLIYAEIELYKLAYNDNCDYFHLMSEYDYIIYDVEKFINFFEQNNKNCISFIKINCKRFIHNSIVTYKASQWKSLKRDLVNILIQKQTKNDIIRLIKSYLNYEKVNPDIIVLGALDEFIIPTLIGNNLNNYEFSENMRYVNWNNKNPEGHPITLSFKTFYNNDYNINVDDILNHLIVRKIDILDPYSKEFLIYLKEKAEDFPRL